uniref:Uncharacterized protein n=1 Tax=Dunaliella tertiolecta TaxID=3047 RepID=A0A7S3R3R1_DUNTE
MSQRQQKMGNFFTPLTQPAAFGQANSEMSISKGNIRPMPAMRGPGRPKGRRNCTQGLAHPDAQLLAMRKPWPLSAGTNCLGLVAAFHTGTNCLFHQSKLCCCDYEVV